MTATGNSRAFPAIRNVGGRNVTIRHMTADDIEPFLAFARALPEEDLLYLRRDITQQAAVESWFRDSLEGHTVILLAIVDGAIAGYATVVRDTVPWTAHVAELRIMIAEPLRGFGLGRLMTQEGFAIALSMGVEKMIAQVTLEQPGAIETFEDIGFKPEALLRDHVKDRDGNLHDILMLSHDVAKFESSLRAYGVTEALGAS